LVIVLFVRNAGQGREYAMAILPGDELLVLHYELEAA
jgi:hypothetical protein